MLQKSPSKKLGFSVITVLTIPLCFSACSRFYGSDEAGYRPNPATTFIQPAAPAPPPPPPAPAPPPVAAKPALTSIYFDLDKSDISAESEATVAEWARYLVATPDAKVVVQANTDSRGSKAYNTALGDRRASAVVAALVAKGVTVGQLTTANFAAEKPLATTNDEAGFAKNRRVDIVG